MNKYEKLIKKIEKDLKKYKTLVKTARDENYQLGFNIIANYLEELLEIEKGNNIV